MEQNETNLSYYIAEKNSILVVSFAGPLTHSNLAALERCRNELTERQFAWAILHFGAVPEKADQTALPIIAKIQKTIRDKGAQLRVAALHPNLRKLLEERGVLRVGECTEDLAQTLQSLSRQN